MRLGGMRLGSDASFHLYIWNDMYEYFLEANPDLGSKMGRGKLDLIRATQPYADVDIYQRSRRPMRCYSNWSVLQILSDQHATICSTRVSA